MSNNQLALDLVQETNNNEEESKGTTKLRKKSKAQRMAQVVPGAIERAKDFILQPPSYKFIESSRKTGYKFKQSIGELADNSVDATAEECDIFLLGPKKNAIDTIIVMDNGNGMDYDELLGSYKLGADRPYRKSERGKFGQGGTLGSLAFCANKTTYSRQDPNEPWIGRSYDLKDCKTNDGWGTSVVHEIDPEVEKLFVETYGSDSTGTIIVHTNLDLLRTTQIAHLKKQLEGYLGETFGEFIITKVLQLRLNHNVMVAKDPLHWDDPDVIQLLDEIVKHNGFSFRVQAVDLWKIHCRADKGALSFGGKGMDPAQGGYFYRCNRLIKGACTNNNGLTGFYKLDAKTRNFRFKVSFDASLDTEFGTNAQKTEIDMEQSLSDKISTLVNPLGEEAKKNTKRREASNSEAKEDRQAALKKAETIANSDLVRPRIKSKKDTSTKVTNDTSSANKKATNRGTAKGKQCELYEYEEENYGSQSAPVVFERNVMYVNLDNPVTQAYWVNGDEKCRALFMDFHSAYQWAALELEDTDCLDAVQMRANCKLRASTRKRY